MLDMYEIAEYTIESAYEPFGDCLLCEKPMYRDEIATYSDEFGHIEICDRCDKNNEHFTIQEYEDSEFDDEIMIIDQILDLIEDLDETELRCLIESTDDDMVEEMAIVQLVSLGELEEFD